MVGTTRIKTESFEMSAIAARLRGNLPFRIGVLFTTSLLLMMMAALSA
tara:strand:- start:6681 stop:6824 length:144 start_codon:yes stop_codon:yes gene_type:complete